MHVSLLSLAIMACCVYQASNVETTTCITLDGVKKDSSVVRNILTQLGRAVGGGTALFGDAKGENKLKRPPQKKNRTATSTPAAL